MPLVAAGIFQAINALLYFSFFRSIRPPEELSSLPTMEEEEEVGQTTTGA